MSAVSQRLTVWRGDAAPTGAVHAAKQGGALALGGQGVKLVLQLAATAVLARLLPPEDFGLLSLVAPIVTFFIVFRDVGLTSATIYTEDITDREVTSLFWINAAAGLVLAGALLLIAPLAARFYDDPRLTAVLSVMALMFVCNGIAAQYQALFQRRFLFRRLTLIDVGANVAGTCVGIAAALQGLGYWSLVIIPVATQIISLIATLLISQWQPGAPRWEKRTGAMTRFGSQITGFNFLNYFARNLDNLLIGKVWGLEALGYYGRAYALMMAPLSQVITPLHNVVVPVLTRMNGDREQYVRAYVRIMHMIMLVCAPLVTWLLVGREWIVAILLGSRWGGVVPIFLALGCSALVQPMNNSAGWLLLSQGRSREVLAWGVIGGGLTVASILAGLPGGALAVAVSYSLVQIVVVTPLLWWFVCRNGFVRIPDLLAAALPLWSAAAVAGGSGELLRAAANDAGYVPAPLMGLLLSLIWILGGTAGVLALHPQGRAILRSALRLLIETAGRFRRVR